MNECKAERLESELEFHKANSIVTATDRDCIEATHKIKIVIEAMVADTKEVLIDTEVVLIDTEKVLVDTKVKDNTIIADYCNTKDSTIIKVCIAIDFIVNLQKSGLNAKV